LEEAKECFKMAIEKNPNVAVTYSWLGDCERKLNNYDEAIKVYEKGNELSGKNIYKDEINKIKKEK
jgi:tetratricopeptide (TPR) repeat protein